MSGVLPNTHCQSLPCKKAAIHAQQTHNTREAGSGRWHKKRLLENYYSILTGLNNTTSSTRCPRQETDSITRLLVASGFLHTGGDVLRLPCSLVIFWGYSFFMGSRFMETLLKWRDQTEEKPGHIKREETGYLPRERSRNWTAFCKLQCL